MKIAHCCKVCNHVYYKAEALNGEPVKIDCSLRGTHKEIKDCSY